VSNRILTAVTVLVIGLTNVKVVLGIIPIGLSYE